MQRRTKSVIEKQNRKLRAEFPSLAGYLNEVLTSKDRENVGLISFNQWRFALAAVVETALEAQSIGSNVTVALWSNDTPLADTGWSSSRKFARIFATRTSDQNAERILKSAGFKESNFARPPIKRWIATEMPATPNPLTREKIRELRYRSSGMGRSILQVHPDFNTPISADHVWPSKWIETAMRSYAWAFDQASALIRERQLTTVVVYNGRFTHDRAVAAAAEQAGIKVLYYDSGGYETDFDLTEATTHDWVHLQNRMLTMYQSWPDQDRDELGKKWFIDRQTHADVHNQVFTGEQTPGFLEELPEAEQIVVFFSSSGDEIVELELDWSKYFGSQEQALNALAEACRNRPGTSLIVRTHPHMRLKPPRDLADWTDAVNAATPSEHFDPTSPVDSYELMRAADIVFTYGSTSGVEAAFLGKPVAVMGPSAYDSLGCAQRIMTSEDLETVLDNPPIPHPEKTLSYGLMMQRRGFNYRHLKTLDNGDLELNGVELSDASDFVMKLGDFQKRRRAAKLTSSS